MLKGGRGASAQSLEAAVEVVVRERNRLNSVTGAIYGFERAADALKGLLNEGVARGAHIVIAADAQARDSDA
jgi:propanol-preferring alcohol dehydrogenase